ncbi:helix-turn-helix domain-containing protein [Saccharopolyspora hirsuta]|uniref:Helix-turn-helix domain-containing protein n=1 Tax=Saccharopolyspora hirsuta TaxID=1837 RepID=A0A5M7BI67_SACHI|nr:helix-turn-helix domain-containing protein [Saccharopolyspora hirsuta]KAA5829566.1 helix-turn-helix domain-containing protein [Saccharopolyspora hirsuta]MBF6511073.1 helix-turn-helix domain-containing protein [Nocardia farcinica]
MHIESNAFYRVKAVAEMLDVSVNTIYRAIDAGEIKALKFGSTLRISGSALNEYLKSAQATNEIEGVA